MVQKIKALAVKLDDLTSILGTHVVEGRDPALRGFPLSSTCGPWRAPPPNKFLKMQNEVFFLSVSKCGV